MFVHENDLTMGVRRLRRMRWSPRTEEGVGKNRKEGSDQHDLPLVLHDVINWPEKHQRHWVGLCVAGFHYSVQTNKEVYVNLEMNSNLIDAFEIYLSNCNW